MGRTRLATVAVAVAFAALGWTLGSAQARQPEFELVITAPGGPTNTTVEVRSLLASRGVTFRTEPHKIATLADREVWLADFQDSEGNTLALTSEPLLESLAAN